MKEYISLNFADQIKGFVSGFVNQFLDTLSEYAFEE